MSTLAKRLNVLSNLGPIGFANSFIRQRMTPTGPYRLRSRYARHPVWVRPKTSDLYVFEQIFREREYRCLDGVRKAELIIDCGANVGYSAAYMLSRFPGAKLIAVEPDAANLEAIKRNLAPYGNRFDLLHAGIWSRTTGLVMDANLKQGQEWARTVRPAREGEPAQMQAVDIGSLFAQSGFARISILKIDIEGSEKEVFSVPTAWLSQVDNLVIELHGPDCERIFHRAIEGQGFKVSTCDELTVCTRS